jgi:CO dehydrogenase maturation factor
MKVAITGKGGVGKTTVAASLARALRDLGHQVVAVDADPDANLAGTLGYRGPDITPLVKLKALIQERVGGGDGWGGFLRMNPRVDDIPQEFGVVVDGIRVLVMGTIDRGRRGCACPENVLLREVLNHLILDAQQDVIVDMEAGVEHLGRGTPEGVDLMLVVVEPGWASLQTARRVVALAADLGIKRIGAVANRVASEADLMLMRTHLSSPPLLATLPADPELEREAREGSYTKDRFFHREMVRLAGMLKTLVHEFGEASRQVPSPFSGGGQGEGMK